MKRILSIRDFWAGALLCAVALLFLLDGVRYRFGSPAEMGPGFFPRVLSLLLLVIGVVVMLRAVRSDAAALDKLHLRPLALVCAALLVFAATLTTLGLVAAALCVVVLSTFAGGRSAWWEIVLLAVGLSVFSAILFVYALGQPIPVWPVFRG